MSGLLQRLAAQAIAQRDGGVPVRIRSAIGVHARIPLGPGAVESAETVSETKTQTSGARAANSQTLLVVEDTPAAIHTVVVDAPKKSQDISESEHPVQTPHFRAPARKAPADARTNERVTWTHFPSRLLPEQPKVPIPAMELQLPPAPSAREPLMERTAASPAPTEVHVHIGRIDVIAPPESTAPKKARASNSRPTVPLSDFLARRKAR